MNKAIKILLISSAMLACISRINCRENFVERDSKRSEVPTEIQKVLKVLDEIFQDSELHIAINGVYPSAFNALSQSKLIQKNGSLESINGTVYWKYDGWMYTLLVRDVYNNAYNLRENFGIFARPIEPLSAKTHVICADTVLGFFITTIDTIRLQGTRQFASSKVEKDRPDCRYFGAGGDAGLSGWHRIIKDNSNNSINKDNKPQ